MDKFILIGNICFLLAMLADSFSSSRKTAKGVLIAQSVGQAIYCAGSIFLKGYSASVQNAVSVVRNMAALGKKQRKWVEYALIVLGVVLGIYFNNRGIAGWLPVIANLEYSIAVFRFKDNERALKISFVICVVMFAVFNVVIMNIVGLIVNAVVVATTIAFLCKKN